MKKFFLTLICLASVLFAAAPTCHKSSAYNYCRYVGKVEQVYINNGNAILIYIDTPLDVNLANSNGLAATKSDAILLPVNDSNKVFSDYFYSTALTALTANKKVMIQMKDVSGGYLVADRIWIHKD